METLVADETQPETTTRNQLRQSMARMSTGQFIFRAAIAAVLVVVALVSSFAVAKSMNLIPETKVTVSPNGGLPSAGIANTINYKWDRIAGPNGTSIFTQCEYNVPGTRIYLSQGGQYDFRSDKTCL